MVLIFWASGHTKLCTSTHKPNDTYVELNIHKLNIHKQFTIVKLDQRLHNQAGSYFAGTLFWISLQTAQWLLCKAGLRPLMLSPKYSGERRRGTCHGRGRCSCTFNRIFFFLIWVVSKYKEFSHLDSKVYFWRCVITLTIATWGKSQKCLKFHLPHL